jgi:hypothetical protein
MQVSRGGLVLHLPEQHGDCCPGSTRFNEDPKPENKA